MNQERLYHNILNGIGWGDKWFEKQTREWTHSHLLFTYINNIYPGTISIYSPVYTPPVGVNTANLDNYDIQQEDDRFIIKNTMKTVSPLLLYLRPEEEVPERIKIKKEDRDRVMVGLLLKNQEYEDMVREEKNKRLREGNFFSSPDQLFFNTVKVDDDHMYIVFFTDNMPSKIKEMYV